MRNAASPSQKNEKESNENWNVYDCNQKCECGGKFAMHWSEDK